MHSIGSGWGKGEHKKIRASGSYPQELVIYAVQGWWWDTGCEAQAPASPCSQARAAVLTAPAWEINSQRLLPKPKIGSYYF